VIFFTVAASTPKDFSITALGMFVWKIWLAGKRKPGSCDVNVLKVLAVPLPTLSWKCCRPRGKRMTSPCCSVAAYKTLSSLMKPVHTEPLSTSSVSAAHVRYIISSNSSVRHLDMSIYKVIACNEISTQCDGFMVWGS
jgi:hypothetical protein